MSLWTFACREGDGLACEEMARLHERGKGVALDPILALEYHEEACDEGRASECAVAGGYYRDGRLGRPRLRQALRLFKKGCAAQDGASCHQLAVATLTGTGTTADVSAGLEQLASTCSGGYAASCSQLAALYQEGRYVQSDAELADAYEQRACDMGDGRVCTALGLQHGPDTDPKAAAAFFERGCEGGDARGCAFLARAYADGRGVTADREQAVELYTLACRDGVGEACGRAVLLAGTADLDGESLRDLYDLACESGDPAGCYYLAGLYRDGIGGGSDPAVAARLYDRACDADVAAACVQMAFMIAATEVERPFGWLERACNVDPQACAVLGEIHEGGFWGRPQPRRAARYYRKACAEDNPRACHRLGTLYFRGAGVKRDDVAAARLQSVACDAGVGEACATLAFQHDEGLGVPRDDQLALHYRERACSLGYDAACSAAAAGAKKAQPAVAPLDPEKAVGEPKP